MCGITGHINFQKPVAVDDLQAMNDAIKHRGPDGEGIFLNSSSSVGLGHRRLSFLDLSVAGKQPMESSAKNFISYNGEIYNYSELRNELKQLGYTFHSHTDTEVILHGYHKWGVAVLSRLKGMFAFAIWDESNQQLFLARDRFGIKPVYYYNQNGDFVFASEIKAIKSNRSVSTTLDYSSFVDFFVYRYVPSPKTIWNEVKKLPPAHYLLLKNTGDVSIHRYWEIPLSEKIISDKEAIVRFDELMYQSVKNHARSDVPIGAFLSGGYDSSAIVYYLSRFGYTPDTFSIGFEGWDVSEHLYAEMVSQKFNTKHTSLILSSQSLDILDHLAWVYDEPIGDISIIPTYLVSQEASKKTKAVMSGEGSDEILVGYQWQKDYTKPHQTLFDRIKALLSPKQKAYVLEYYAECMSMGRFNDSELRKMLHPDLHQHIQSDPEWFYSSLYNFSIPDLKAMQLLDVKHFMGEQVLTKIDRASMANSLEVRVPFLDHEIAEFVFQLDTRVYYKPQETKHLLYQNIKHHLPQEILNRKKQGFVGPDTYYMNMDWYKDQLNNSKLVEAKIVNEQYIQVLFNAKDHWRLWKLAVMETWYRKWI